MIYPWQQKSWDTLKRVVGQGNMPHAILLAGPEHTGKHDFALTLAQSLLCESRDETGFACGVCQSCHIFKAGSHPDYTFIGLGEKKTQIVVDQIRTLNDFVHLSRSYQGSRVVLLSPVERLNINASNSLLKTLEEPPERTVLLLVSSNPSELLPTIKSRCQLLHLPQPTLEQASEWLSTQELTHSVDDLLAASLGKPLLARTLDQDERLAVRKQFAGDILKLLRGSLSLVSAAKNWEKSPKQDLIDWQLQWVELMIKGLYQSDDIKKDVITPHLQKHMKATPQALWQLRDGLLELKQHVHTSLNTLLYTENMLVLWHRQAL
ncbi:DNA polymerase III subunit delta' [Leucothrix arctica]|uniref:DNA-directed DNA polymerase n=1 Tax=Leucothrix arctica TaxID=1481894 RepID=A0A317CC23_9GAMM|nr:DNA polymerase III subunit delta' [Leucothrix arctica]PWQ93920.1 DNA polymerase III subunit delta' [Leucothrix arctica]